MTDFNKDSIHRFVKGLHVKPDSQNQGSQDAASEASAPEPTTAPANTPSALSADEVMNFMNASAAPMQLNMSVSASLSSFEPFLNIIQNAFSVEFANFNNLPEETRRNMVLQAANILMDKEGVV